MVGSDATRDRNSISMRMLRWINYRYSPEYSFPRALLCTATGVVMIGILGYLSESIFRTKAEQRPAAPNALELKAEDVEPLIVNCGGAIYTMNFRLEDGVKRQTIPITIWCGRDIITTTAEIRDGATIQKTKFGRR